MDMRRRIAIIYDFDLTLIPKNLQEYGFIDSLNMSPDEFWEASAIVGNKHDMDSNLAYMYTMIELAKKNNQDITYEGLKKLGANIEYFEGVEEWFDRINEYGKSLGLEVEHYVISSGTKEIIEGTSIYDKFKRVYGCRFTYDDDGKPIWVSQVVNYTAKTQFIYRIRKNVLDDFYDSYKVNEYISDRSSILPYENMIYIGDGQTDVPSMKLLNSKGGHSICVYDPSSFKKFNVANRLFNEKRVNFIAPADYRDNSKIDSVIKNILKKVSIENTLEELQND